MFRPRHLLTSFIAPILAGGLVLPAGAARAAADAWQVNRISGHAWVATADGQRTELAAGMALAPGATLSTADRSRVMLVRGAETMMVGPKSVIAVSEHPTEGLTTTVLEKAGTVQFDVEKRNVHYFSVETPMLAAVVKGTRFTVSVGRGRGGVAVSRGTVQVSALATGQMSDVTAGQHARVGSHGLSVGGAGRPSISVGAPRAAVVSALAVTAPNVAPQISQAELAAVATVSTPAAPAVSTATAVATPSTTSDVAHTSSAAAAQATAPVQATPAIAAVSVAALSATPPGGNLGGGLLSAIANALSGSKGPQAPAQTGPNVGPKPNPAQLAAAVKAALAGLPGGPGKLAGLPGPIALSLGLVPGLQRVGPTSPATVGGPPSGPTSAGAPAGAQKGPAGPGGDAGSSGHGPSGPVGAGGNHGQSGRGFSGFGGMGPGRGR